MFVSEYFFFFFQAEDGIRDYKVTGVQTCALPIFSERRNTLPLNAPGSSDHAGLRHSAAMRIAAHTPAPMNGKRSEYALNFTLTITLTTIAASRMDATIATRGQSTRTPAA